MDKVELHKIFWTSESEFLHREFCSNIFLPSGKTQEKRMTILFFPPVYSKQWGAVLSIYLILSIWNLSEKRRSLRGRFLLFQVWGLSSMGRILCSLVLLQKVATFVPLATWAFISASCQCCLLQAGLPEKPFFHKLLFLPLIRCCADLLFVIGAEKAAIWKAAFQA